MRRFRRAIVVVCDGLGVGEAPDAAAFGDEGSDTLGHVLASRDVRIPHLKDLGLGVGVFNALSAGLVMGVMIIPTVASLSEDAMSAVPRDLRYGAYALGSSKLQVSTRIVVPAAVSGIVAAFVLGISRAIGETMIVLLAAGQQPTLSFDPRQAVETMSAFIAATGAGDVPTGSTEYKTIFAVGATLFVMTLILNFFSIRLVRKYREVYE